MELRKINPKFLVCINHMKKLFQIAYKKKFIINFKVFYILQINKKYSNLRMKKLFQIANKNKLIINLKVSYIFQINKNYRDL